MCFGHYNPNHYYQSLFNLQYDHNISLNVVENWYPFELNIYVDMLSTKLDEKRRQMQQRQVKYGR